MKVGDHYIKHRIIPAGVPLPMVGQARAEALGRQPTSFVSPSPSIIHELWREPRYLLMSDSPEELTEMGELASHARGKVLIGGLGLGILARMVAANPLVDVVHVVEVERSVVDLARLSHPKVSIIVQDVMLFIASLSQWDYDVALFDFWMDTSPFVLETVIEPLRAMVAVRFGSQPMQCWREDWMRAMVANREPAGEPR